jgi:hypothetical protein
MGLFTRNKKPPQTREIKIQAGIPEGGRDQIIIESMLTGYRLNFSIPGTINAYQTYDSQVYETYRKYNALSSFGNQQVRAVIDLRTAFISGEGVSVSCETERTAKWIEMFLTRNLLHGPNFMNAVKGSEMAGQALFVLGKSQWFDDSLFIKATRFPYNTKKPFKPIYKDPQLKDEVIDIMVKGENGWESTSYKNFIYVRTGGDDTNTEGPVTKVGTVLTDIENYDRAIKDMRRNNHVTARVTPVFETESAAEATSLKDRLNEIKWKIGEAFIGKAKFRYETPARGAHDNLTSELTSTIKTISAVTGIPVHWLGFVDLMSNRSTAESLYELIKNATILERQIWESALYVLIVKAQELYINAGGEDITELDYDFQIRLPLIDFNEFLNRVRGLQIAYTDRAISMDDYRNMLPGIDPVKTKRAVEREQKEDEKKLMSQPDKENVIEGAFGQSNQSQGEE